MIFEYDNLFILNSLTLDITIETITMALADELGSTSMINSQQQTPSTLNSDSNPIAEMLNMIAKFF